MKIVSSYHRLAFLFLCLSAAVYGHNDPDEPENKRKLISGYVTSDMGMLEQVSIHVKNTERQTFTDAKGFYSIEAAANEILVYTYYGMKDIQVMVEDVTKELNVKMNSSTKMLNEVKLQASANSMDRPDEIDTSYGRLSRQKLGVSSNYLRGSELNPAAVTLIDALRGKIPGYQVKSDQNGEDIAVMRSNVGRRGALWDVDGVLYTNQPPPIQVTDVLEVNVIKSPGGSVRYGNLGANGVIVVKTVNNAYRGIYKDGQRKTVFTNENIYQNDAQPLQSQKLFEERYMTQLEATNSRETFMASFEKMLPVYRYRPEYYLDVAEMATKTYGDPKFTNLILEQMEDELFYQPEGLKALGYYYQKRGNDEKALRVFQRVLSLRPAYAQSYRDLAQAYKDFDNYEKAWKYYMEYLYKGNTLEDEGIGELMYHEMEEMYIHRKGKFQPKERFVVKTDRQLIPKDLRLVFEWNTSEAEFELEFVNPEGQAYSFLHNYEYNSAQINEEKSKGYSSKEFFVQDLQKKGWLVNLIYQGNKKNAPTYMKMTIYRDWADKDERKEIRTYKLMERNKKFALLRI